MNSGLLVAAALMTLTAVAHSFLGERYILRRLFKRDNLPHLFGSDLFTKRTIRFAWHITSVAWLGFAALLVVLAGRGVPSRGTLLQILAATFLCSAAVSAIGSRGRHLSWPVFTAIALLAWLAAR